MRWLVCWIAAVALVPGACGEGTQHEAAKAVLPAGSKAEITAVAAADLPAHVRAAALAKAPGLTIAEAERKARDGMVFYDVEGTRADGNAIELDILDKNGVATVVEMQRDIEWAAVPVPVRTAAAAAPDSFTPQRVIESTQNDGTVIYELFAAGKTAEPAVEIDWKDGKAAVRRQRNVY